VTSTTAAIPKRRDHLTPAHGVLNVLHVLATHALLILWFWLGYRYLPLAAYIPLTLPVCLVHQRAMSEWIHEGAHLNLVANRRWNDRLTDALCGFWFVLPVRVYREIHFQHHRKPDFFVADDPDTVFLTVESRRAFWLGVLRDLTGLTVLRQLGRFNELAPAGERRRRALTILGPVIVVGVAFWLSRLDAALLYYFTLATLYPLLNRLRTYAQHVTIDERAGSQFVASETSRTVEAGLLDRIVHTSPRLLYHHEHHLYPHLPYRALRHILERSDDPNRYSRSRWGTLRSIYRGLPRSESHP
jgi:fatty acid desaturase